MPNKAWRTEAAILFVGAGLALGGNVQAATSVLDLPALAPPAMLFEKNGGGDELGLGLANDPTIEIEISRSNGISNVVRIDPVPLQTRSDESSDNVLIAEADPGVMPATVPEPSTWAMMLLGFISLGFAFRQSRRKVSFA
jgi:hypothetical protein